MSNPKEEKVSDQQKKMELMEDDEDDDIDLDLEDLESDCDNEETPNLSDAKEITPKIANKSPAQSKKRKFNEIMQNDNNDNNNVNDNETNHNNNDNNYKIIKKNKIVAPPQTIIAMKSHCDNSKTITTDTFNLKEKISQNRNILQKNNENRTNNKNANANANANENEMGKMDIVNKDEVIMQIMNENRNENETYDDDDEEENKMDDFE